VHPAYRSIVKATPADAQLPHARPDLDLRAAPRDGYAWARHNAQSAVAEEREMLDPHAGSVLWTRQYISSWWQLAVHMFPTVRFRNDVDDQRPGAIHPPGPETKVYRRVYQQVSPGCLLAVHRYTYGDTPRNSPPALSRCPRQDSNLRPTA
jgi:hypothetical protein